MSGKGAEAGRRSEGRGEGKRVGGLDVKSVRGRDDGKVPSGERKGSAGVDEDEAQA